MEDASASLAGKIGFVGGLVLAVMYALGARRARLTSSRPVYAGAVGVLILVVGGWAVGAAAFVVLRVT